MTFTELIVGRKVRDNDVVSNFAELPFAKDVSWTIPGETLTWVRFTDGSYWVWSEGQHYGVFPLPS